MIETMLGIADGASVDQGGSVEPGQATMESRIRSPKAEAVENILHLLRLSGGVFLEGRFTAPWSITTNVQPEMMRLPLSPTTQVIGFHYVVSGRLVVHLPGGPAAEVTAGEIIFVPRNDLHILGSASGLASVAVGELDMVETDRGIWLLDHGHGGAETRIVCGFLASEADFGAILMALPQLLTVRLSETSGGAWIEASLAFASRRLASGVAGATTVVARLSELMVAEAVRSYLDSLTDQEASLFSGFSDDSVSRALGLMHSLPAHPWSTESLAHAVNLSRSAFADRFMKLTGQPPKRYLTAWRMHLAARGLRGTLKTIAQISFDVGYESEAAFTRAFRRAFGDPPASWRRQQKEIETRTSPDARAV